MKRKIVVLSGAGLSADSGIKTFRDKNGLWENYKIEDVAEHNAWLKDRGLVLRFYADLYEQYKDCKPHEGHYALVELEEHFDVFHVTQNVDNLLEQAGCSNVTHIHGLLSRKKCEWHNDILEEGAELQNCDYKVDADKPVELGDFCPRCQGQMRPDIVWFNERVHYNLEDIKPLLKEVKYNDGVFICVGTSFQVFPAGYMVPMFSQVNNKYIVDPNPKQISNYSLLEGTAKEMLPLLKQELLKGSVCS